MHGLGPSRRTWSSPWLRRYFRFAGRLTGKALFDQQIIPAHLTLPLYKHMLAWPITLADMEFVDADVCRSMQDMLKMRDAEDLCLDFTITTETFGEVNVVELKEGGEDIDVDNDNRHEYCQLMLKHIMVDRIQGQLKFFLLGF